ncbi:MAG: hypothetical protein ABIJ14_03405 [Nanoarchaeota archaeon]
MPKNKVPKDETTEDEDIKEIEEAPLGVFPNGTRPQTEEGGGNEESDLIEILDEEDELEERFSIDEHRFTEFLQPVHSSSPVLEQVAVGQGGPVFFAMGGGGQSQGRENNGDDDPFKYANQGGGNGEDPKYVSMSDAGRPLERVDFGTVGREQQLTREAGFVQSTETRGMESQMYEKKRDAEIVDPLKVGTEGALKKEKEKQYWIK